MCERFNQELKLTPTIQFIKPKSLDVSAPKRIVNVKGSAHIIHGVIPELQEMPFGFHKRTNAGERFMYNARAEGVFNKENKAGYSGELGIHQNCWAMEAFYSYRAVIPVTSFIEGPEKKRLKKPFDVSLKGVQQFYLAAIVDTDIKTGRPGFCIVTCWPNELMLNDIGYQRMPVILKEEDIQQWLNPDTDIESLLPMLKPYASELMETHALFATETV